VPTTSVTVNKVWSDDNDAAGKRPGSITVQLLKDGNVYDTKTLSSSNSWKASWYGLSIYSTWTVSEEAVTDYASSITGNGTSSVTITNTYVPPTEPEETPDDPTTNVDDPDVPKGDKEVDDPLYDLDDGDVPQDYLEVGDPDVPKTDDGSNVNIWLLIALLSGAALIASAAAERRRDKHSA
ncbi:MAG: Cna B-type domain-containing protein, partial [Firmicutes bacterium]|nr:Cna B-type domain-containing protein [Bacillota bacterium]